MIDVSKAKEIVLNNLFQPEIIEVSIHEATGYILQEDIVADRDFPPFNRVSMDGIAINYDVWVQTKHTLMVEGMQTAGVPALSLEKKDQCLEVMTGAVLPINTDTVIPYEDIEIEENGEKKAIIQSEPTKGQNIHQQAADRSINEILLTKGMKLQPPEIAVLASVGKASVKVAKFPKIALVTTGDELVEIETTPLPYQIRKSNVYALDAALQQLFIQADHYHFVDEKETMQNGLKDVLDQFDVLILSGGVSRGKKDFVPEALEFCGVQKLFHKVKQKPGKPFWFGKTDTNKTVFALPGNPVSTFMCFYQYIKPWLELSLGTKNTATQMAVLQSDVQFAPPVTYFMQVKIENSQGVLHAFPEQGQGSGDFANLLDCQGFLVLPADESHFKAGTAFPYLPFR